MRGKVAHINGERVRTGIIPAYAGKRPTTRHMEHGKQDHPRVCGEKGNGNVALNGQRGSSPRMRGKALHMLLCVNRR